MTGQERVADLRSGVHIVIEGGEDLNADEKDGDKVRRIDSKDPVERSRSAATWQARVLRKEKEAFL